MHRTTALAVALMIAVTGVVGAASFTQADVTRDVSGELSADGSAVVGFGAGEGSEVVNNELTLNFDNADGGLNENSTFTYGDSASVNTTHAFSVTNNDGEAHDFTFDLSDDGVAGDNIEMTVYSGGSAVGTLTETSGTVTASGVPPTNTIYVVVTVTTDSYKVGDGPIDSTLTVTADN